MNVYILDGKQDTCEYFNMIVCNIINLSNFVRIYFDILKS